MIGTTANQKKLLFKLRTAKSTIVAFESRDLRPDKVDSIEKTLDVTAKDVVDLNCRLADDRSINTPIDDDAGAEEWQDHLVDQRHHRKLLSSNRTTRSTSTRH